MRKILTISLVMMCVAVRGEIRSAARSESGGGAKKEVRTWTTASGEETIEGEYSAMSGDLVMIRAANNRVIKVPFNQLSDEDKLYVEYKNPPKLKVEFRQDTDTTMYVAESWKPDDESWEAENQPIYITDASFGAEIFQQDSRLYKHDLVLEVFVLTTQRYDSDKYHLIAHFKSKPFRLNEESKFEYKYFDGNVYTTLKYDLSIPNGPPVLKRGEEFSNFLVVVRDENGDVIAHNGSKNWLFDNLDRLEKLPLGAWMDDNCIRVHPTPPRSGE